MPLFQNSVVKKYLAGQDTAPMHAAFGAYLTYFHDPMRRANIRASKEEQFQEGFLRELFVKILGYTINPDPGFNLTTELKNIKDSKKTDGAILKDGKAIAVIELKGTDTKDLEKIRDQAFNYKNNHPECIYVITSNFEKLRFYIHNAVDYIEFSILQMQQEEFRLLWLLLQKDNLLKGIPQQIKTESLLVEEQVTKKLYSDYSAFKQELWQDIVANNPGLDELLLYKKSQKLLDRFLFIFFAEDKGLLPPNSISEIVKQWDKLAEMDEYRPLYDRFKKYFGYMNTGRLIPGKAEIHAYNGGLFAPDELLDSLTISDALLKKHVSKLTEYDFESEVDTNILGHIFEHSLNDIENVRASLEGTQVDKSKTKRKKDGVFYTPKYITKYIVDNTVGKLCTEKKAELGIIDEEFSKGKAGRKKDTLQKLIAQLKAYREWLLQLAICDPACGSGAFLNQVLEFLMAEHRYLDELESMLFESSIVFPNVENHILENNIFGVDINEESVEIARLSLWLRTAQKGRKLSTLSSNIKVGNSLIDDPEVAGDLAFDWHAQFPKVFAMGGFDVVVGNPPYVDVKRLENNFVQWLFANYEGAKNRINLYSIFIEKAYLISKGINAHVGYIIPNSILLNSSYSEVRQLIFDGLQTIVKLPDSVFEDATVETIICLFQKGLNIDQCEIINFNRGEIINEIDKNRISLISKNKWSDDGKFNIYINQALLQILDKISDSGFLLESVADFSLGLSPYDKHKGHSQKLISERGYHSKTRDTKNHVPLINGENIRRFQISTEVDEYIEYGPWLGRPREERFFKEPRVIVRQIVSGDSKRIYAGYTSDQLYFSQVGFGIISKSKEISNQALSTILSSSLMSFYHKYRFLDIEKDVFQKILIANCKLFPISRKLDKHESNKLEEKHSSISFALNAMRDLQHEFVGLVISKYGIASTSRLDNWPDLDFKGFLGELTKAKVKLSLSEEAEWMAYFHEQKAKAQSLQSDITRLDREIDMLVYELYGLTEEEIRVVEQ
jgi:type I restriction-modification system DNA methylase subunit